MLFLTTTALDVEPELMNRALVLTVDEDPEQTKAIHQLQRTRETLAGLEQDVARDQILRLHQNAQRLLRPVRVLNPFAESLSFTAAKTRTRRDHAKYLTLIRAIALLHQHQRKVKTTKVGGEEIEYIEVETADIERANTLMRELLSRALDDLAPQTRRLLHGIERLVTERAEAQDLRTAQVRFTRREVREHTGMTYDQVRLHLRRLVEMEYVTVEPAGAGRSHTYRIPDGGIPSAADSSDSSMIAGHPGDLGIADPKVRNGKSASKVAPLTSNLRNSKRSRKRGRN